ncbi:hypothetical protein Y032_0050g2018 [Ancylostoma ceylanicum]|uniref:Uncharacterized protein n=1 Tax=Ancylostoma ceylanicum TaxID=53326 RepID=A0A016U9N8_9BILA|nr:hypothetical protein Y032_0050g2018 [Ancylostoma ceylanicum]
MVARTFPKSCRFESALSAAAALLALRQAARSVKHLTHNRSGFFNEFDHLFISLVVLRKQAIKFTKDNGLMVSCLTDRAACPNASRAAAADRALMKRLDYS